MKRNLQCACCGNYAGRWEQHWNQDTGYGVCASCVEWISSRGETVESIVQTYGSEGVNWGHTPQEDDAD
ncbi:hypothetical protein [Lysobacter sp. Hz 25]|uniref:hypothetical protein n=1 Tax=Lysobacter sp. Hz 25 TaxID=3383698 RepID=UPI0038D3FF4F